MTPADVQALSCETCHGEGRILEAGGTPAEHWRGCPDCVMPLLDSVDTSDLERSVERACAVIDELRGSRADLLQALNQALDALEFAQGALIDAIGLEDGLDGEAGARVIHMIRAALQANGRPLIPLPGPEDEATYQPWSARMLSAPDVQALEALRDEMRMSEIAAGQCALESADIELTHMASAEAERLRKWRLRLGVLLHGAGGLQHEPGCPAIADDESDYEHLADAGTCVCSLSKRKHQP